MEHYRVSISANGRMVLPARLREQLEGLAALLALITGAVTDGKGELLLKRFVSDLPFPGPKQLDFGG